MDKIMTTTERVLVGMLLTFAFILFAKMNGWY